MASPNTAVYSTVISDDHNCSMAQGNRSKRLSNMAIFLVCTMFVVLGIPNTSLTTLVAPYEKHS